MKVVYEKPEMIQNLEDKIEEACQHGKVIKRFIMSQEEHKQYKDELYSYPVLGCSNNEFCGVAIEVQVGVVYE